MRNREVYTYTDLKKLGNSTFWNEIREFPQICVSADMRKCLKGSKEYDGTDGLFYQEKQVQVWEFRRLYEAILPKWTDDETKFHETVVLAQFIREQIALYGDDPSVRRWLSGCRRNLNMLLSSIILLEEAGISPEELEPEGDRNIRLMTEAWKYLKEKDPAIPAFHKKMEELKIRNTWEPVFFKLYGTVSVHTLVFHGFYYFTSIQERILRTLEAAGIRLIFLFRYDEKYPYVNEIWRKTYSVEMGYPPMNEWHMDQSDEKEPFGEIFEGRRSKIVNQLEIYEYSSVMEFVNAMKNVKKQGFSIYSSNHVTANDILKDFYPETYGDRKLLSYPIGQFVSILNQMWDEDLQEIVLDTEQLIECFMTGWLAADGISGKQYMEDLIRLLPFFSGCSRRQEWEERMVFLEQIYENVLEPFHKEPDTDENIERWQEVMGEPLLNFSIFSVPSEKLEVILKLIRRLLTMAEELFGSKKAVRIQEYVRKLDHLLKSHEMSDDLFEEERKLVVELFSKLEEPSDFQGECFPSDISDALNLYLSGRLSDSEIQEDKGSMVSPIYQVEAKNGNPEGKVHICLCDAADMPGGKKEYVWPLTGRQMKACYLRTWNPLIVNMMHIMDSSGICNRYFMYSALRNKEVQLSWISNMGDKLQAPSPYVTLICEAAEVPIVQRKKEEVTGRRVQELGTGNPRICSYQKEKMPAYTVKEAKMDYAICPMKYALGYVVEKYPVFQNEFHQNYAVNGLIAAIHSLMKEKEVSVDEVFEQTIRLFPAMKEAEKRQVYDYLHDQNSFTQADTEGISELKGWQYTDQRLKIKFPNKDVRDQAMDQYACLLTPEGQRGMDLYRTAAGRTNEPGQKKRIDVCLFCQHQSYCRYAVFQADQEMLYD